MRTLIGAAALSLAAIAVVSPALADTKAGVDAWNRGDYATAIAEWRKAAITGDADAQFNLGMAYKLGRGVPVDLAQAESWYRKAAIQGHPEAQDNYGLALFQDGKRDEAVPWLEKSAARGEPRAELVLGTMLFNGDSVQRDWVRAYALMVRASNAGLAQGSQTLAEMDRYIPADQRQQGIELARKMETQTLGNPVPGTSVVPTPPKIATTEAPPTPVAKAPKLPVIAATPPAKPEPRPVVAPPKPTASPVPEAGRWRVQFGAFRDEGNAKALWETLKGKVSGLSGMQPFLRKTGAITKLQAGPVKSAADADRLCASVKRAGSECVPVAP